MYYARFGTNRQGMGEMITITLIIQFEVRSVRTTYSKTMMMMMMMERCMKIVTKCYAMPEPASLKEGNDKRGLGRISEKG